MSSLDSIYYVFSAGKDSWVNEGLDKPLFEIWVGSGDREWMEVHYVAMGLNPLESVTRFVPEGPCMAASLVDACILFYPSYFKACGSMNKVRQELKERVSGTGFLDLNSADEAFMSNWIELRAEAMQMINGLKVCRTRFERIEQFTGTLL